MGVALRFRVYALPSVAIEALRRYAFDVIAVGGLFALSLVIDWDFLTEGDYLPLPWGDWMAQAYRVRFLQEHGLATWDHNWAGGLSLFQNYQFVPQGTTAIVADLADASVGRTMLFLVAILTAWVRVSGYATARVLGFSQPAALMAGVITFGLNDYASDIVVYSSIWSLALLPAYVAIGYRVRSSPWVYCLALLSGLSVYVHPLLMASSVAVLIAASVVEPISVGRALRLAKQALVVLLASAFFWVPAFFSARPVMQDPTSADVTFLRAILDGGADRFADVTWILLPLIAGGLMLSWRNVQYPLLRYACAFCGLLLFLIGVSYTGVGPEPVRLMQSVRLSTALPLGIAVLAALAVDATVRELSNWRASRFIWSWAAVLLALGLAVPLADVAADQAYRPAAFEADPLDGWLAQHRGEIDGRVWLDEVGVPWYTFKRFDEVHASMSHYPVGDWSLLARPQQEGLLLGVPDFATTEQYLKAMAVSHLVLGEDVPARQVIDGGDAGYEPVADFGSRTVYRAPWQPVEAFYTSANRLPDIALPDTPYESSRDRSERDRLVREYNRLAYSAVSAQVSVDYPAPTTMRVRLEDVPPGQYLVISENWDRSWRASTADGRGLPVERFGPNYIAVDLSGVESGVVVELTHEMSKDWKVGIALVLLAIPVAGAFYIAERRATKRR